MNPYILIAVPAAAFIITFAEHAWTKISKTREL